MVVMERKVLGRSRVGIAGVGGLGSHVAVALVRAGVGGLVLADFDSVEESNLERQCYFRDQVGRFKVEALSETLVRINPVVEIRCFPVRVTADNLVELFDGVDVMVEAFDRADQKSLLVSTFRRRFPAIPLVAASGVAGIGPANRIITRRAVENLYICGDGKSGVGAHTPLQAPRVGIVAHHQALAVLRLLHGLDPCDADNGDGCAIEN
ncbi:MAG: sulfur carrier protein ThiS adenylyltransferase ThiF [Deltaproteobacteria bacterium]|nr:sulfur carrier protein ThiS adenylyltransferase ThiF [Deltaproteobacteria bacterium]